MGLKANFLNVQVLGHHEFLVVDGDGDGKVNLATKSYSRCMFQTIEISCVHAFTATRKRSVSIYSLCSPYYRIESWRETYKETIYLVGNEDEWVILNHIRDLVVDVPVEKNPVGRPKKKKLGRPKNNRYPFCGEKVIKPHKCSICGGSRHNRKSCSSTVIFLVLILMKKN
ncbi:uncharacterized protein LOC133825330 [Humulus lupulus]|uniref:uncharacterized protein LOC133825330 n=1 Tax=Humulus lupulus TaxID=3486 RepID=UPI002B41606F|nr:uncharacterized protein LOC133825330 [Humulus lupulus]